MTNTFSLLDKSARRYAGLGAVYVGLDHACTWAELRMRALALAASLSERGTPGDRVLVAARNHAHLVEVMFGVWGAGRVLTPINAKLHPREMSEIVEDAAPEWILADPDLAEGLVAAGVQADRITPIEGPAYDGLLAAKPRTPQPVRAEDLAWLFYTSGTTGRSKGAMLSHRSLMAMTLSHLADFEDLGPDDSIIHAAPMSHGSGLYTLPYVARGSRQVIPASRRFDPSEFYDLCEEHPGSGAFLAPTMVQRLRTEVEARSRPPKRLRSIIFGGGPTYVEDLKRSRSVFGPTLRHLYGQGEAPMTIAGIRADELASADDDLLASVGWPRSGVEVKVFDEEDRERAAGEIGEIVCRGDVVMSEYWNNPDATAATLRNGWLHTGDLGVLDEAGRLTLSGRSKEVIISGGTNIYPVEVEQVLLAHPDVREVAVLGAPDAEWGEIVVAFVVLDARARADEQILDAHCRQRIGRFKRPKRYVFLPGLPVTNYGKVSKRALRDQVTSGAV